MTIEEVILGDIYSSIMPEELRIDKYGYDVHIEATYRRIVEDCMRRAIAVRKAALLREGFNSGDSDEDNMTVGVILDIPFDLIGMITSGEWVQERMAKWLLRCPLEKLVNLTELIVGTLPIISAQLIHFRPFFKSFPLMGSLLVKDRSEYFQMTEYISIQNATEFDDNNLDNSNGLNNVPLNRPAIIVGTIYSIVSNYTSNTRTHIKKPHKRILAKYYRCMNDHCRTDEPVQTLIRKDFYYDGVMKSKFRYGESKNKKKIKCQKCWNDLVELTLLTVIEFYEIVLMRLSSDPWGRSIKIIIPESVARLYDITKGSKYAIIGYARCDLNHSKYSFLACGMNPCVSNTTLPISINVKSSYTQKHFCHGNLFSISKQIRQLQWLRLLSPQSRVIIISLDDPWHLRAACQLYNGDARLAATIDPSELKDMLKGSMSINLPSLLLLHPSMASDRMIFELTCKYECLLNWTRRSEGDEEESSFGTLLDYYENSELIPHSLFIPSASYNDNPIWDTRTKEALQSYFVLFHDLACHCNTEGEMTGNSSLFFPLHQPAQQFTLLSTMVESANAMFTTNCAQNISIDAVILACVMGEILLENRFWGRSVFNWTFESSKSKQDDHKMMNDLVSSKTHYFNSSLVFDSRVKSNAVLNRNHQYFDSNSSGQKVKHDEFIMRNQIELMRQKLQI